MRRHMPIAWRELGIHEIRGRVSEQRIIAYDATTSLRATSDEVPWCSAFVNWVIQQAGYRGTGSAAARSWLNWGSTITQPEYGAITILSRDDPAQGHVGFWVDADDERFWLLGGNQGDAVSVASFSPNRVLGYRWPLGPE